MKIKKILLFSFLILLVAVGILWHFNPRPQVISLFSLSHYPQNISNWIPPEYPNYDKPLISITDQQTKYLSLLDHLFGKFSPWSETYVTKLLTPNKSDNIKTLEKSILSDFNNSNNSKEKIQFGENFRPHTTKWIETITANIPLDSLTQLTYQSSNRAIAVDNLYARLLPTDDPSFFSHNLAGQGYPFDNLQISSVWAGTPLYILGESNDKVWSLVLSPDLIAWVKTNGIARVDEVFVLQWISFAEKNLAAITHTPTSLIDEKGQFLLQAYIGSVFPALASPTGLKLLVPKSDEERHAIIKLAAVDANHAVKMPWPITPHHFADLFQTQLGRPYGWGNIYFYNDCSSELKNLFTPFGIWLPRHSAEQVYAGKVVDMTKGTPEQRLTYLKVNGQPLLTLIYIGGHVILYAANKNDTAISYQDMWG